MEKFQGWHSSDEKTDLLKGKCSKEQFDIAIYCNWFDTDTSLCKFEP